MRNAEEEAALSQVKFETSHLASRGRCCSLLPWFENRRRATLVALSPSAFLFFFFFEITTKLNYQEKITTRMEARASLNKNAQLYYGQSTTFYILFSP